jgi:hypothetical protein
MTWREFMLTTCAWIIAMIAGVMSYVEVARSEPLLHIGSHLVVADQHPQASAVTAVSSGE